MKIREYAGNLAKSELFIGSMTLLILINIGNFFNYLFQFVMARMLGPADYAVLAVLTSIFYIFNVPSSSIQTVVSSHTTRLNVRKDYGKIKGILNLLIKKLVYASLIAFIIFIAFSFLISKALNISIGLLFITGLFLFGGFLYPAGTGILQGMKKFGAWGWNFILGNFVKLIVSIVLVMLGFRVYGAVTGFVLGTFVSFIFIFPAIKEIVYSREIKEKITLFSKENLPTLLAMLLIVLMYSFDVIVAKMVFPDEIAGKYAVASMIGKIILFASTTVGNAMFPISSEKFVNGGKARTRGIILKSGLAVFTLCACAVMAFALFPKQIVSILFGQQYIAIAGVLTYVGIAFSFISFLNIFTLYKISVNEFRIKHIFALLLFFIIQITALAVFSGSLAEFSLAFMISTIIAFAGSFALIRG